MRHLFVGFMYPCMACDLKPHQYISQDSLWMCKCPSLYRCFCGTYQTWCRDIRILQLFCIAMAMQNSSACLVNMDL